MMLSVIDFIIICLAVIRLDLLVRVDSGPYEVMEKLRHHAGVRYDEYGNEYGTNEFAMMILCYYCNSIWIGLLVLPIYFYLPIWVLVPLAVSAITVMYNDATS